MRIFLIRHGETSSNVAGVLSGQQEVALTALGKQQAITLRTRLAELEPELLLSSDLSRARETLSLAMESDDIQVCPELRERSFGIFEGQPLVDYLDHFEESGMRRVDYAPPGGEGYNDMVRRLEIVWDRHLQACKGNLVIAAHGALNRVFIKWCLGEVFTNDDDFEQHNACLNILHGTRPGEFSLELLNCTRHLRY